MKNYIETLTTLFTILMLFGNSCKGQTLQDRIQLTYDEDKHNFDTALILHFPSQLLSDSSLIIRRERIKYNDVGFFLYNYTVSKSKVDSIERKLSRNKLGAKYASIDTCLLIVNRFAMKNNEEEDIDSYPIISDSSLIERKCYNNLLPVPNFLDYNGDNTTSCGLDSTFVIYVLEAKAGLHFEKYKLSPSSHMPKKWKNGYSKGVAISKKNSTVIYWSIVW